MKTRAEARAWYLSTRKLVRLMRRIGDRYWDILPWDEMAGDERSISSEQPGRHPLHDLQ
jgi:hypothetical protein